MTDGSRAWLVVNADDLGVSPSATLGVLRAHRDGIVTSASLAVTTPGYQHAVDTCVRACPDLGVGLHFTLTAGAPVSAAATVPLLVGPDGFFRWQFTSLLAALSARPAPDLVRQIDVELGAQLARLQRDDIAVDHIDGERHVHLIPAIFALVIAAARRHRIPFVRAGTDAGIRAFPAAHWPSLALRGGLVKSRLLSSLATRARAALGPDIRTADRVASYLGSGQTHLLRQRVLAAPAAGITEIMVHPGSPGAADAPPLGNPGLTRYLVSADRARERDACIAARAWVNRAALTNYTRLATSLAAAAR